MGNVFRLVQQDTLRQATPTYANSASSAAYRVQLLLSALPVLRVSISTILLAHLLIAHLLIAHLLQAFSVAQV